VRDEWPSLQQTQLPGASLSALAQPLQIEVPPGWICASMAANLGPRDGDRSYSIRVRASLPNKLPVPSPGDFLAWRKDAPNLDRRTIPFAEAQCHHRGQRRATDTHVSPARLGREPGFPPSGTAQG